MLNLYRYSSSRLAKVDYTCTYSRLHTVCMYLACQLEVLPLILVRDVEGLGCTEILILQRELLHLLLVVGDPNEGQRTHHIAWINETIVVHG